MGAYIIAEAGVNHNGRLDLARELCLAAKNAGADCVKFQTWQTEKIITRSVAQADYQADNTGRTESQFDMLKRLELSYDDFRAVKAYCDEIGIQFASTADEADSLDFLLTLGICLALDLDSRLTVITVIAASAPPAALMSMFSAKFKLDTALASSTVSVQTAFSALTMPLMVSLANYLA